MTSKCKGKSAVLSSLLPTRETSYNRIVEELTHIRGEIDRIDDEIVRLLAKRFACSRQVAKIKNQTGTPVFDAEREARLLKVILEKSKAAGLAPEIAKAVFDEILHQSRRVQETETRGMQ